MPRLWYASDLSVSPPSREMAATDTLKIPFESDSAATSATCALLDLATGSATAVQPTIGAVASNIATVTVDGTALGLERGHVYELRVTFADADEEWSGTLALVVVA